VRIITAAILLLLLTTLTGRAQRYSTPDGKLRVALVKQPFSPTGTSTGPNTMANGGIQPILAGMGAVVRIEEVRLTIDEATEYGAWKNLNRMIAGAIRGLQARERQR